MDNLFAFRYGPAFGKHRIGNLVTMSARCAVERYVFEDDAIEVEFGFGITFGTSERNVAKVYMVVRIGEPINQYLIDVLTPLANLWETYDVIGHALFSYSFYLTIVVTEALQTTIKSPNLYRIDLYAGGGETHLTVNRHDLYLVVAI